MEEETPPASATSTLKENLWGVCSYASLNGIELKAAFSVLNGRASRTRRAVACRPSPARREWNRPLLRRHIWNHINRMCGYFPLGQADRNAINRNYSQGILKKERS